MADIEAAAVRAAAAAAPPQAPAPVGTAARRRAAVAEKLADIVIYCCLGAMWVSHAAGAVAVLARYAVGWTAYAVVVVRVARVIFLGGIVGAGLLCPFTTLVLLLRIKWRRAETADRVLLVEGVYVTLQLQLHGREPPVPRRWRQGVDIGIVALLMFVFFSMIMLVGLLMQERLRASVCWEDRISMLAWISDIGSFACSSMVMFIVIPYLWIQVMILRPSEYWS